MTQRLLITCCIRGCCCKVCPNALRTRVWLAATATHRRMPAADPSAQSSLVWCTISRIALIPRPGDPTRYPAAPRYST